jgi:predicted nucleic acid-binding protein
MQCALVDASAVIALFDVNDKHHAHYSQVFADLGAVRTRLYTTWSCITEASYFLAPQSHLAMLGWVEGGGVHIYPLEAHHLADFLPTMVQYSEQGKRQMDLADASLYYVANDISVNLVLTLDKNDFNRYRLPSGLAFEII